MQVGSTTRRTGFPTRLPLRWKVLPVKTRSWPFGVKVHGDIRATLLDAHNSAAVRAIDEVAGDGGVLTKLGQKERAHAAAEDVVVREDDVPTTLDVHRVADGAELAAGDAHLACADDVEGSFAWSAAGGSIRAEVGAAEIEGESAFRSRFEANRSRTGLFRDLDEILRRLDDEVLAAFDDVFRQIGSRVLSCFADRIQPDELAAMPCAVLNIFLGKSTIRA